MISSNINIRLPSLKLDGEINGTGKETAAKQSITLTFLNPLATLPRLAQPRGTYGKRRQRHVNRARFSITRTP